MVDWDGDIVQPGVAGRALDLCTGGLTVLLPIGPIVYNEERREWNMCNTWASLAA